ncbi:MAG: type III-A CRISPR-associated protein Cas10/Csm1 [Chloroflexota bacterium]
MNDIQIALASLTRNPGLSGDWGTEIVNKLGKIDESAEGVIALASELSAGGAAPGEKVAHLQSIFDHLSLSDAKRGSAELHYFAPRALSLQEHYVFPEAIQRQELDFKSLQEELGKALPQNDAGSRGYLEEVLAVFHRLASNLPSSVLPDVSLYDHQRLTAALAVCLLEQAGDGGRISLAPDEPAALLVGGDFSGIQDFIYTIRAKGAARTLRGRSFYLQLLTEAALRFTLRELELPYTNVIYSGGGHFFLLAPCSKQARLEGIQEKITSLLADYHGTSLYLALGHAVVPRKGFAQGNFPTYWGEMHASMAQRKARRYSELGAGMHARIFSVAEHGGNPENTCDVCGEDHRNLQPWKWKEDEEPGNICTLCASFETIGTDLKNAQFVAIGFGEPGSKGTDRAMDLLAGFGMSVQFVNDAGQAIQVQGQQVALWALDDPVDGNWPSLPGAAKWLRYTANRVPDLSFDELQKKVDGGFERLGALRMDVDDLGELFKRGLGNKATLTRLATLSFRASLFFEGWLKKLCEKEERKGLIYTVYAGGDDLFLIGPWDLMPGLAQEIASDFARYTGQNPDIHASAGMAFIDGKYPVYQAAEDAGEALGEAKALEGKNAFSFLGKPWPWPVFTEIAVKQTCLQGLVSPQEPGKKPGPQAILHILQQLALEAEQHRKVKGRHVWGRWIWMGMYQLTRMQERRKDLVEEIKAISDELQDNVYQNIDQWGVAARWTQLLTRKKERFDKGKKGE